MLSLNDFFDRVAALKREGQPFAVATVVARRPPVSAHLGDRAIVFADGRMDGFVGGACSREIIRKQGLEVLRTRAARLVSIRPDPSEAAEPGADRVIVPMTCASEGAVDVYVEPIVKARAIVVVGATPVADAVARLARAMRYDVVRVVDTEEQRDVRADSEAVGAGVATLDALEQVLREIFAGAGDGAVVVASQGHYDEPALETVLKAGVPYVGLLASRKRGAMVRAWLTESHVPNLDRLRNPAGLDLGARSPEEVAVSILGEIVQLLAQGARPSDDAGSSISDDVETPGPRDLKTSSTGRRLQMAAAPPPGPGSDAVAIDPVCHMEVAIASAKHVAEVEGVTYYFCCPGCRARFVKDPQRYLSPAS
jgi:xanthine dehydrogenase accessory factor